MAYNKIGFLASGAGGRADGIGEYVRRLDAAGIPAVVMCNDGLTGISDALDLIEAGSRVPHVMAFRVVKDGSESYAVPDYGKEPPAAAREHWGKIRPHFPARLQQHRDKVWVYPVNEPDKNRADWLGRFGVELAKIAGAEGYRVALFGFSTGEPEPAHWETPGMLAYLRYCEENPDRAAFCLHEYSLDVADIRRGGGHLVGRFTQLFDVCDRRGIARPKVLIGEWGWGATETPAPDRALADIRDIAGLYARYPEVLGAGVWYLGSGFSGIANRVQPLIAPVTEMTLSAAFPGPAPAPTPEPEPGPAPQPAGVLYEVIHPEGLIVRAGPTTQAARIGGLPLSTQVSVEPAGAGWGQVLGYISLSPSLVKNAGDEPAPIPAGPLLAVDVSEHQGDIDWSRMWAKGVRVAMIRLGDGYVKRDGSRYEDARWRENWARAGSLGISRGAYYYYRNHEDAGEQARHFMSLWRQAIWELPPAGDFEDPTPDPAPAVLAERIRYFLELVESGSGSTPFVYTRQSWWNPRVGFTTWAGRHPLWVAMYPAPNNGAPPAAGIEPLLPAGWSAYTMWQWCGGPPGGAPGPEYGAQSKALDLNWYYPDDAPPPPEPPAGERLYTVWPTTIREVTQYFGENPADYARFGLPGHDGVDLEAPRDTPVYAPAGGTVSRSADSPGGYGWHVVIEHDGGDYRTTLAHLSRQGIAPVGTVVRAGDIVGASGNTGNSSGYHLHVGLRKRGAQLPGWPAEMIDPWPYLRPLLTGGASGALFGLHASADGNLAAGELQAFQTARIEQVKALSSMSADDVSALAGALPAASFIIRAFLSFGDRHVSPAQFCDWTLPDVKRALGRLAGRQVWVELHNEPNLYLEGLGRSWPDGIGFANWLNEVIAGYRAELPGVRLLFPGLSPGGTVGGVRLDSKAFIEQAQLAVSRCDGLGVHTYWAHNYPMRLALDVVDDAIRRHPATPIFITEASNNKGGVPAGEKGAEYVTFWREMNLRPTVRGVTYFVASATHRDFQEEVWVSKGAGRGIAEVVGAR